MKLKSLFVFVIIRNVSNQANFVIRPAFFHSMNKPLKFFGNTNLNQERRTKLTHSSYQGILKNRVKYDRKNLLFFIFQMRKSTAGNFVMILWIWIFPIFFALDFLIRKIKEREIQKKKFQSFFTLFSNIPWLVLFVNQWFLK